MLSLPDWAFYPLATAAAAGMIALAVSFGESDHRAPEEILAEGLVYDGPGLAALQTGNGLTAEFLTENGEAFVRISAARGPFDGIQSAGAFFTLTPEEREALQGHRVRIRFNLRQADVQPAEATRLAFLIPGLGQDSWQRMPVGEDFAPIELDIEPPSCVWTVGFIGLWPDWTTDRNTIDLESVELMALEPVTC
ncbi:hypothetical protein [Maricaulis sp.]|uniref:hypothetical protein n=1 Tax=Maricaulis sp. TaxID=1486257 RepID=UPI0025BF6E6C|nr:hypothetical protein [Maricaulis sp.]